MAERSLPNVRVRRLTPNKSSRNGATPRVIVLHSTEGQNIAGLADLVGLGAWFANPKAQVSSHVATDAEGNSARYVADTDKAWHCANFNGQALGIEQVGKAAQLQWEHEHQCETARWIAYWSRKYGIPIQKGAISGKQITRAWFASDSTPQIAELISPHQRLNAASAHAGVDTTVIALWLGHESTRTTDIYLQADLALKEKALARTAPPRTHAGRYRAPDSLLAFLDGL